MIAPRTKPNVELSDYGEYETAWCPGCGNFAILKAVKRSLVESSIAPHELLFVSGIGQAAKAPHYLNANLFNGLHGRALPVATGARLVNRKLKIIVESGDGCMYGEGGNHFLAAIRRNVNMVVLVHDNQVYGLTKGQASPTSPEGFVTKAQPHGTYSAPFNPVAVAVAMNAGFVARGFSGNEDHLVATIKRAIAHEGFAVVDILQPCVSFNKINTYKWYKERCKVLPADYTHGDWTTAMSTAMKMDPEIPVGVIYENKRPSFESHFPASVDIPSTERTPEFMRGLLEHYM
jgi:2-oxoglutarate/2-oxoacid ferredoxin oxidoreductase subunit beta